MKPNNLILALHVRSYHPKSLGGDGIGEATFNWLQNDVNGTEKRHTVRSHPDPALPPGAFGWGEMMEM